MTHQTAVDMLIHVDRPEAKALLAASLAEVPGVLEPGLASLKPNLLFIRHDPEHFDIRRVPDIARSLGIKARIVEV